MPEDIATAAFDFVIVGGGSAGCVLANRLSADGRYRVCLIEAGGRDSWIWFHIPVGYLFAIGNPRADWMFQTEAIAGLGGRALAYPRGKVLGGSSAINAMIYMRGQAEDYDRWRDMGLDGWGWDDVLPLFRAQEDYHGAASAFHGRGGPLKVARPRVGWAVLDAFIAAAGQCGIAPVGDFNTGSNAGCGYFDVHQHRGRRWSAARAFLAPALSRPNLAVMTGSLAERVVFADGRAVGVEVQTPAGRRRIMARREVVLAAGAVATPALLERSGVGDAARLKTLGIAPVTDLKGVGENLQDHLQIRPIFKVSNTSTLNTQYRSLVRRGLMGADYVLRRRGPLTMAPSQLGAFTRSSAAEERPDLQFHVQPLSLDRFGEALHPFDAITVSVCNLRPHSRGSIHARSADAAAAPVISPDYLSAPQDRTVAVEALRLARRIMQAPAMARHRPEEFRPGAALESDADLLAAARAHSTTIFHPVGTARMGRPDDPLAVTDARLRVLRTPGLRVVDASVMPFITSGNTNAPTMMIAEKGARMILEDAD